MTEVVIEAAAFVDAVKRAAVVAPTRGKAYDESAGIMLDIDAENNAIILRSTNGIVWFREWVQPDTISGPSASWRVMTEVFAPWVGSLPIGSGKKVTLKEVENGHSTQLLVSSAKSKSKMNLMSNEFYPDWDVFDPADLVVVNDFAGRVKMVDWAAGTSEAGTAFVGIHFDGETVRATDRYRLAVAPLPLGEHAAIPATVQAGVLGRLLRQTGEVRVSFTENHMLLMPNETSQIKALILAVDYPPTNRIENRDYPASVNFQKEDVIAAINRALLAAPTDRVPLLAMYVGAEELSFRVGTDTTTIIDTVDVRGQAVHKRVAIYLTPKTVLDTLSNAVGPSVTLNYDPLDPMRMLYVTADNDYEVWMSARKPDTQG